MQNEYEDKSIRPAAQKREDRKPAEKTEDFFFPGSGEYKPRNIKARNLEEAIAIWETEREAV